MGGQSSGGFKAEKTRTLIGHKDTVSFCAFSPDEKLLATCSCDHTVLVWKLKTSRVKFHFKEHLDDVTACAFSPDSTILLTSSRDRRLILWSIQTGDCMGKLRVHSGPVLHCSWAPDSLVKFASASEDQTAILWDIGESARRPKRLRLEAHTGIIFQVCFSPDNVTVATCSEDRTVRIWNRTSGKKINKLVDPTGGVITCQFSPDGTYIACVSEGQIVRLWSVALGEVINVLEGCHTKPVTCCAIFPAGGYVITGAGDKAIAMWDVSAKPAKVVRRIVEHTNWIQTLQFSRTGKYLASGANDKIVILWT